MKIVLVNGPPRSGKDTLAQEMRHSLTALGRTSSVEKFADELKRMTHRLYGILNADPKGGYARVSDYAPEDFFEATKDEPCSALFRLTPRQAYIGVSELLMKEQHGEGVFGRILANRLVLLEGIDVVLVPDSGFAAEARVLVSRFRADNVYLVRLHRPGCDFSRDSRSHVDPEMIGIPASNFLVLQNEGPRESVRMLSDHVAQAFDL